MDGPPLITGPLPLLRDLPPGEPVERCQACGRLVLSRDRCQHVADVATCLGDAVAIGATYAGETVPASGCKR